MKESEKKISPIKAKTLFLSLAATAYFVFVLFSHEWVSLLYLKIFNQFGRSTMEASMHLGTLLMGIAVIAGCLFILKQKKSLNVQILLLWVSMVALIIFADIFLIVTNIERIHYIQYAFLSILIRMIILDNYFALFLTVLAGVLDELFQYVWAPEYTRYLDFNDFVLNLLGGLFGILLYLTFVSKERLINRYMTKAKVSVYVALGLVLGAVWLGIWGGRIISYDPQESEFSVIREINGRKVFVLSFVQYPAFWTLTDYGRRYHILSPLEGTALLGILLLGYKFLLGGRLQHGRRNSGRVGS